MRRTVHHRSVEFNIAISIRQTAKSDAHVVWVVFDDINSGDDGIQCIAPTLNQLHCLLGGAKPVSTGNCQSFGRTLHFIYRE